MSSPPSGPPRPRRWRRAGLQALLGLCAVPLALSRSAPQEVRRLEIGLDLAWQVRRASPQVSGAIRVDAGSRDDPAHQVGLARLLVDLLASEGSAENPRDAIDAWLGAHGATLEVGLDGDQLALDFRCATDDLGGALEIASDLLGAPALGERALESAKNRMVARLGRLAPASVADRALVEVLQGDAALGARLPHRADVAQLTTADLEAFHRAHVTLDRISIALDGPLPEEPTELVAAAFAGLPAKASGEPLTGPGGAAATGAPAGHVLCDLPDADHTEVRMALGPVAAGPEAAAALWLHARYHTPPPRREAGPASAAELAAAVDLAFEPARDGSGGMLSGAVAVPHELALAAGAALARALVPPEGALLEPGRLEEARAGVLAVLEPAEDRAQLLARLARSRAGTSEEQQAALVSAIRTLDGPAVLAAVRAHAAQARATTVYVGPAALLAEQLAKGLGETAAGDLAPGDLAPGDVNGAPEDWHGLTLRSGLRQPRGDSAALALRARLLAALGGGERWAELDTLSVEGQAELAQLDQPVPVAIARDLWEGSLLIRQRALGQETLTVSTRTGSWIRNADTVTLLDPERHAALRAAEERQFFRLVVELARAREWRLAAQGERLELWRGAERFAWFELGPDGLPLAVGHDGDPAGSAEGGEPTRTELSEWTEQAGFVFPARMHQEAKGSTQRWTGFEPGVSLDPALLVRPGG